MSPAKRWLYFHSFLHFNIVKYSLVSFWLGDEILDFDRKFDEKLNIKEYDLSKKQSFRRVIDLNEAILPYIKFTTPNLQNTLTKFKSLKLNGENLKGSFAHKTTYKGLELSFALGGIHGAKKGIYESDKNFIIKSFDVTSFYPNIL